jgi:hypothetical protein
MKELNEGKGIEELARKKGFRVGETGFFTRASGVIPNIGPGIELMGTLSTVTEEHPVPKEFLQTKDGLFVVKLVAWEAADESKFSEQKDDLKRSLIFQKQENFFNDWLEYLKTRADIEVNKELQQT